MAPHPFEKQQPIIRAGLNALAEADYAIDKILALKPDVADTPGPPYMMISNPDIPRYLTDLANAQSLAYACLFDDSRRSTESARLTKIRLARVAEMNKQCAGIKMEELRKRGVRNALAHFDERILKEIDRDENGSWLQDLGLSHAALFDKLDDRKLIRVYMFHEDRFVVLGEHLRLIPLKEEIKQIFAALGLEVERTTN